MSLQDFFKPLFQASSGLNPADIIAKIRSERNTMYYVDTHNYNQFNLENFIAEENCSLVFHIDDGFNFTFRNNFIINISFPAVPKDAIVLSTGFEKTELNTYAVNGATIFVSNTDSNFMHQFTLQHFSNRNPGKVEFSPVGYTANIVTSVLKLAPEIKLLVKKSDFPNSDIDAFIAAGKERVKIEKEGFTQEELDVFARSGATIT